ncbi:LysM peptidoglycan-binding domain-containing protein [Pseudaquabacterium rugosum]|jgi:hypothetical protein|uniref:LysM domain-containing protein n=1 Tax=Pseudaquabacterium rugosum TaxID=2984194 RepID=A0ABU9B4U7_9BURK
MVTRARRAPSESTGSPRERPAADRRGGLAAVVAGALLSAALPAFAALPVLPQQRATAQQVAQAGVPLSELAPDAPDSYTVKRGDTLWDISRLFLRSPWRWPELWGMNLQQIRNPHLIYPGQLLELERVDGRARLRMGRRDGASGLPTVRLQPRVRSAPLEDPAISAVSMQAIAPFLNEAQVLTREQLDGAPRIVATPDSRVLVTAGQTAYVRGDLQGARDFMLFRETRPLVDPQTREVLGYEAAFVGTAEFQRPEDTSGALPVPASFVLTSARQEAGVGDRLVPLPPRDYASYAPHAPQAPVDGRVVSVYGEAVAGGSNQVVAINRGTRDGLERGHVLAVWRAGKAARDTTLAGPGQAIQLPDERSGLLFVFRTFDRVSYALIVQAVEPVRAGDRFSQP